jgi:hypothetical protein
MDIQSGRVIAFAQVDSDLSQFEADLLVAANDPAAEVEYSPEGGYGPFARRIAGRAAHIRESTPGHYAQEIVYGTYPEAGEAALSEEEALDIVGAAAVLSKGGQTTASRDLLQAYGFLSLTRSGYEEKYFQLFWQRHKVDVILSLVGFALDAALCCAGPEAARIGVAEARVLEESYQAKHLLGTPQSAKMVRAGEAIHVFQDAATLEKVTDAIRAAGIETAGVRGWRRFGLRFHVPIGYRIGPEGTRIPLFYGELKLREGTGLFHVVPRRRASGLPK